MAAQASPPLPSGLVGFVKREGPTCQLVAPVLARLAGETELTVFTQDDPALPRDTRIVDDRSLEYSWHHAIETVPTTLLRVQGGEVVGRAIGWQRDEWEELTGVSGLGPELPAWRPGCGSLSVDPDREAELLVRFAGHDFALTRSSSRASRTSTRPPSRAAGPTACPSSHPPRSR